MAVTPILDTERRYTQWLMREIYKGPNGDGKYVPNVDDQILDWDNGIYRVISVDHGKTNLSYWKKVNLATLGGGVDDSDLAVIAGPGTNSNSFRVYVNTEVVPHELAIDSRVLWNGSENAYVKIFKGTDTSASTGQVISAIMTSTGKVTSENLPLTAVIVPNGTNVSMKTASTGVCTETVKDGDVVTIVTYTQSGAITSVDKFIVCTTNLIRTIDQSGKYITNIELVSPYISKTDAQLVECPINMITQSMTFSAKVSYSDGTSAVSNIDGGTWNLQGLDMYIASQIGQTVPLILTYTMGASENAFDATAALYDRVIVREYRIRTVEMDTFYAVKLFCVPQWNNSTKAYVLQWYLYNLDRKDIIDVTSYVEYTTLSPKFVGDKYSVTQNLQVAFNMQNLGSNYSYFRHVQLVSVSLTNPGQKTGVMNYFTLSYATDLLYGSTVRALYSNDEKNSGKLKLNLSCGYEDSLTWLTHIYRQLDPLYFNANEAQAPLPTHARVIIGTGAGAWQREVPIADIVKDIHNINYSITQGSLVRVELYSTDGNGDALNLAVAPFTASAMV